MCFAVYTPDGYRGSVRQSSSISSSVIPSATQACTPRQVDAEATIKLKKPSVPARAAFDENLTSYKDPQNGIPALFVFNALLIASSGTDMESGSIFWPHAPLCNLHPR